MNSKNEKIILSIIKYTPPIFIVTLSIIISFSLYLNNKKIFEKEKVHIEKEFIDTNKELIKNEVDNVYEYILTQQKNTENKLKKSLKDSIYKAYSIAMNIYNENKHLDKEIVKKMIKDALRNIRFNNGRGYFFIYSMDYECVLLPINPNAEGKRFYNFKDSKGKYLTRDIIRYLKKENESYMQWWYHKPSNMKKQFKKIGFNKYFEPFDWFIGTGEYVDDFENDIKKDILNYIQNLKYTKNGYIFVIDYNGIYLSHKRKEIVGLNAFDLKNIIDNKTIGELIKIARTQGEGFLSYEQKGKNSSNVAIKKTSYVRGIQNWQWFIGKGFYEDDMNKILEKKENILNENLKENINNLIIWTSILTIVLLFVSIYVSRILEKRFEIYKNEIELTLKEITKQHTILAHQSKMAAIGEMIANIAHQWRQPLSIISTLSTGLKLQKDMGLLKDEDFSKSLEQINNATQYLSTTIDDFRNFFSKDKNSEIFCVKLVFEKALNIIGVQFKNKDIEIIQDIKESYVKAVESELIQVAINILNNSRDELLKIEDKKRLIFINTYQKGDFVIIEIKDNAGGIKKEVLEHVFEPYYTTKHKSQGTGIGLYMSQEIITKHLSGQIYMENCEFTYEDVEYKGVITTIKLKKELPFEK